jgi:hypothetical protein
MTLERWSVHRYQLPQLDIEAIRPLEDALEVSSRHGVFRLSYDDCEELDHALVPMLDALRDPRAALWQAVREEVGAGAALIPMLCVLDDLGLIRECGAGDPARTQAAIVGAVRAWSAELGRDLAGGADSAIVVVEQVADRFAERFDDAVRRGALVEEDNFFVLTLVLQAQYLRTDAPAVLALLVVGLRAAVRRARLGDNSTWWFGIGDMPVHAEDEWSCGLVDLPVVRRYLGAVGRLVRAAVGPGAGRRVRAERAPVEALSGINFMLDLETEIPRLVAELGPSPAQAAVADRSLARRVIRTAFLQEYLVTCRFAECLAPLLSRRFADSLHDAVHRYFEEETGHDAFEREYCLRLGFSEQEVDEAEPLPLHLAFVDILIMLARESPIAVFCASPLIEGVMSTRHALALLAMQVAPDEPMLIDAIGDRAYIEGDPDHRRLGRDWMNRVPLVTPRLQQEIAELIAYLGELNWRRWEKLLRVCARDRERGRSDPALRLPLSARETQKMSRGSRQ